MKKVLFLINTLGGGGAEKVLIDTVNNLNSGKYDITVQTIYDIGVHKSKLAANIKYKSIIYCKNSFLRRIISKVMFSILGERFIYNRFVRGDYDYEIAFLEGLSTKILSKSSSTGCKKFAWIHIDLIANPNSFRVYGSEAKEGEAYHTFDKIFCVSNSVRDTFIRKYGITDKAITLYNIIDDKAIIEASNESIDLPIYSSPAFISVGRLTKQKGYERLLRVHKKLIEDGYLHSLLIIGDGELRNT